MKWLWRPEFSWADMLVLLVVSLINGSYPLNFFIMLLILFIGFSVVSVFKNSYYHESLPRNNQ
jgi:hypothetical protein